MPLILTNKTGINLSVDGSNLDVSGNAAELLTLISGVDGAGSGLDADLLDGQEAAAFATAAQGTLAASALQASDITVTTGANGTSVRFPSGVQVCYRSLSLGDRKAVGSGAEDSPYGTTPVNLTWEQAFSATPSATATISANTVNAVDKGNIPAFESVSTTGMTGLQAIAVTHDNLSTSDCTAHVIAIGTWV